MSDLADKGGPGVITRDAARAVTATPVVTRRRGRDWRGWKFMWPFAVVFVFVFVVPVVYAVWISLFRSRMV
ncbi:MAG: hypothetical protein LKI88_04735, partial [Bifidobacterium sp.]|nr:hypothetical protein [Bifidobacterium sp.]MCI1865226.1 hypothetical protein [Bifidobacterium sp.]